MRAGSFRWPRRPWYLALAAPACSNIIGISSYEIEPALDPPSGGSGVVITTGDGGEHAEQAGQAGHREAHDGGTASGGSPSGGAASGGTASEAAGAAGEPPAVRGCHSHEDCDDSIECTVDRCLDDGDCQHEPSTERCDAGNCEMCAAGIGCVAATKESKQLLVDPKLDDVTSGWTQVGGPLIVESPLALSLPHLVQLGPAAPDALELRYSDLYQAVTIPAGTVALSLTLDFRFTPGMKAPDEEYAVAALYRPNATDPALEFHEFAGSAAAQPTWKRVTYKAAPAEVARLVGQRFTFDLVAHSFEAVYQFDDLQLNATLCR